ncbi:PLP-dependent transferase [Auriculariales sp. MPI-PUGE-AT-0066]|nr:PLP-dependent transferase [Auriculariales sp. MPI-PUGE-AT-0066]
MLGAHIPANDTHALSVSLPEWIDNVGYVSGEDRVIKAMRTGYPRFFIQPAVKQLCTHFESTLSDQNERALIFPNAHIARAFCSFVLLEDSHASVRSVEVCGRRPLLLDRASDQLALHVTFVPERLWLRAKQFWQHTGWGMSNRLASVFVNSLGLGGSSLTSDMSWNGAGERPRRLLRERIASWVQQDRSLEAAAGRRLKAQLLDPSPGDVFLYQSGMAAIWTLHHALLATREDPAAKSICFGFGYTDTIKVLTRWGPGCAFFGHGDHNDLESLKAGLKGNMSSSSPSQSSSIPLALWCESPSNPLLRSVDLPELRKVADAHRFPIVVDDTIGNFTNVDNVMGGSVVLNPNSIFYPMLKENLTQCYTPELYDTWWFEDAVQMEANSHGFVARSATINVRAERIADYLHSHSLVKRVYYPKFETPELYALFRRTSPEAGYGGLMSLTFHTERAAHAFYDALGCCKGPSLGTEFTLACPYTILGHWKELEWAARYGVEEAIVRISVGCEDEDVIMGWIETALRAAEVAATCLETVVISGDSDGSDCELASPSSSEDLSVSTPEDERPEDELPIPLEKSAEDAVFAVNVLDDIVVHF